MSRRPTPCLLYLVACAVRPSTYCYMLVKDTDMPVALRRTFARALRVRREASKDEWAVIPTDRETGRPTRTRGRVSVATGCTLSLRY